MELAAVLTTAVAAIAAAIAAALEQPRFEQPPAVVRSMRSADRNMHRA